MLVYNQETNQKQPYSLVNSGYGYLEDFYYNFEEHYDIIPTFSLDISSSKVIIKLQTENQPLGLFNSGEKKKMLTLGFVRQPQWN